LTGFSGIALTTNGRPTTEQLRLQQIGFIFNPKTCEFWGVDEEGKFLGARGVEP
jgi:hypothetical protein